MYLDLIDYKRLHTICPIGQNHTDVLQGKLQGFFILLL